MDLNALHEQRRLDVEFLADAVRQLNEAELRHPSGALAKREYLARCLERLRADACPYGCTAGHIQNFLPGQDSPCPLHPPENVRGE